MSEALDLTTASFAKTEAGQQEIQKRAMGLSPLVRRLLVLIDGQRTGKDLSAFVTGSEVVPLLQELLDKGCVEVKAAAVPSAPAAAAAVVSVAQAPSEATAVPGMLDAATRTPADNDMARNFMINTVNTVFGLHSRLSLLETISRAKSTEELRQVFLVWQQAMENDRTGAKRLGDFREKLFKVL